MPFPTISVKNSANNDTIINSFPTAGAQPSSNSLSVTIATDQANVAVAVQGTANVQFTTTPTMLVGGTANVQFTTTPAVTVDGTSNVAVLGTANVSVLGTANVQFSTTPSVTISGTPAVTVSGTSNVQFTTTPAVTVSGTSNVQFTSTPNVVVTSVGADVSTVASGYSALTESSVLTRLTNGTVAYTAGQIIGGSATIGSASNIITFPNAARVNGGGIRIDRIRMFKNQATAAGNFQLTLFRSSPTLAAADAGLLAGNVPVGDAASTSRVIGRFIFDMTLGLVGSDGAEVAGLPLNGSSIECKPAAGSRDIYGVLTTTGAYSSTTGELFSFVLESYTF